LAWPLTTALVARLEGAASPAGAFRQADALACRATLYRCGRGSGWSDLFRQRGGAGVKCRQRRSNRTTIRKKPPMALAVVPCVLLHRFQPPLPSAVVR